MERGRIVVSYERFGEFSGCAAELTPEEDADFRKRRKQLGMQEWDGMEDAEQPRQRSPIEQYLEGRGIAYTERVDSCDYGKRGGSSILIPDTEENLCKE